ncbi:ESX secretion-associated protein EspG [Nocardia sp. NPDC127579]|uniref:ESX secretion-associated protein EspG n=1 Tax=Nocardia sp. NPDC127579 TaxID=3345402 RepID=UPI00363D2172
MMADAWHFTDLEFVAVWESLREGAIPPPFVFTSRTPLHADFTREKNEARARIRERWGDALDPVLAVLAHPDIRVLVQGWSGGDPADPAGRLSVLGVRHGHQGYLVQQTPGETIWHSRAFTIAECDAVHLGAAVGGALPECAAGKWNRVVLDSAAARPDVDYVYGRSLAHELTFDPDTERRRRFDKMPEVGSGRIEISQARSRFGPRGVTRRKLGWRDLEGDGRYAITDGRPPVAIAADPKRLISLINAEIAEVVRAIKDERV